MLSYTTFSMEIANQYCKRKSIFNLINIYDIFDRSDSPFSETAFAETSRENFERIIFDQKKF